jgi:hypothetical protein
MNNIQSLAHAQKDAMQHMQLNNAAMSFVNAMELSKVR